MTLLAPFPDWNYPLMTMAAAREVSRVDLREVPLESMILFTGTHSVSAYMCRIEWYEGERKIKIWSRPDVNCVIGSIDLIESNYYDENLGKEMTEKAVMEINKGYSMPYFRSEMKEGVRNVIVDYSRGRVEGYTSIFLQTSQLLK